MSTASQPGLNRLANRDFMRCRKNAVEDVQWTGADTLARYPWCNYSIVPVHTPLSDELDETGEPTAIRVFQIKTVPCMCRLLGASQGPSGDAQSGTEAGGRCCFPVRFLEIPDPQIDRWADRAREFAESLESSAWGEQVPGVFQVKGICRQRLSALARASRRCLVGWLEWPDRREPLPPEPDITEETAPSPEDVLNKLRNRSISHEERRAWVVEAEALSFKPPQIGELASLLRAFIEERRDSDEPRDIVAVGSAIRKYVATTCFDDMPSIARLLDAGHKAQVPLSLELEICKMVLRKLVANPCERQYHLPDLETRLADVVHSYVNDRLLPREKYGATALNAVLALALLNDQTIPSIAAQLWRLKAAWFRQLVARQARKTRDDLSRRFQNGDAAVSAGRLAMLAGALANRVDEGNAGTTSQR
jgi:hypothetical protein